MTHTVERLDLPPDAVGLARALSDRPGVVLALSDSGATAYVASDPVARSHSLDPEPELVRRTGLGAEASPRWFGLVPYEACRGIELGAESDRRPAPLVTEALWLRYDAVARVAGGEVSVIGDDAAATARLVSRLARRSAEGGRPEIEVRLARPIEPAHEHAARVCAALEQIARGNVYQVNLARRFDLEVSGAPWDLLAALGAAALPPHAFALRFEGLDVTALSPELCLSLEPDGRVLTSPIKGTRPRHADPVEDARVARELDADPKERAELTMILDVERNDLGRVAEVGSVRLARAPHVVALTAVHHRLASIEARLSSHASRASLLSAMLPSGSVTGAPKRRAMEIIRELEPHRRGLYTGTVGIIRRNGGLELGMAIRTIVARGGLGHYYAGGGVVADSQPEREVEETLWKARELLDLCKHTQETGHP